MKVLTHKEKLDEIHDAAEMFLEMQDDLPEIDRDELVAMLVCFASGEIMQLNEHNKALSWAAKWVEDSGKATGDEAISSFASNMAMTLRSVMRRDEPDAESDAKTKAIVEKVLTDRGFVPAHRARREGNYLGEKQNARIYYQKSQQRL